MKNSKNEFLKYVSLRGSTAQPHALKSRLLGPLIFHKKTKMQGKGKTHA